MIGYEVEVNGLEEQLARFARYDEIANKHLSRAMSDSVKAISRVTKSIAPVGASGLVRGGVEHEVLIRPAEGVMGRVIDRTFYARWVEYGTKPHGVGSDVIASKFGTDQDTAFLIARSIKRRGTRGRHFMYRAFKATERAVKQYFARALERITEDLGGRHAL